MIAMSRMPPKEPSDFPPIPEEAHLNVFTSAEGHEGIISYSRKLQWEKSEFPVADSKELHPAAVQPR
jgi:hypothetical protein